MQINSYFLSARGTYANALRHNTPTIPKNCAQLNVPGNPGRGEPSCLLYSGECHSTFGGKFACAPEPAAQPNEISCWCKAQGAERFVIGNRIAASTSQTLQMSLLIDKNLDGLHDDTFHTDRTRNPTSSQQARLYQLFPQLYRLEWEDLYLGGAGDYNDFVSAIEIQECDRFRRFPVYMANSETPYACHDVCADNPCKSPPDPLRTKVSAALAIDREDSGSAGGRESIGRVMHLTVNLYHDGGAGALAICPVPGMNWPRPRTLGEAYDQGLSARYSANQGTPGSHPRGCEPSSPHSRSPPTCDGVRKWFIQEFTIAFARETALTTDAMCGDRSGPGDVFFLPSGNECGAGYTARSYEISLGQIDSVLTAPSLKYSSLSYAELDSLVKWIDVFIFYDISNPAEFRCPSGTNVNLEGVDPAVAKVAKQRLGRISSDFKVYPRL